MVDIVNDFDSTPLFKRFEVHIETAKRHKASLTILSVFEASEDPLLQTPLGRDLARLLREDKEQRLRKLEEEARRELPAESITRTLLEGQVAWHTLQSWWWCLRMGAPALGPSER